MSEPAKDPAKDAPDNLTGTPDNRDPFDRTRMDALLANPDALTGKSESELAAMMGVSEFDRSATAGPEGDATMHELERRAAATPTPAAAPAVAAPAAPAAPAAAPANPAADAAALAAVAAAAAGTPTAEAFVEARDGKGKIPFAVLQAERRANKDLRDQIARLTAGQPAPGAAPAQPEVPTETEGEVVEIKPEDIRLWTDEEVTEMRANYPEKLVDQWVRDNKLAVASYTGLQNDIHARQRDSERTATMSVVDYIDGHPVLSVWSAGANAVDQKLFEAAVVQDRVLRDLPEWKDRPWQERMDQAARNTAAIHGIQYPGSTPAAASTATPQLSLAERANAVLAAAANAPKLPTSHSDLPAGTPAGAKESDVLNDMSPTQIEAKLAGMTPVQMEKYLASIG